MAKFLKVSTASQEIPLGPLVDDDGVTAYTTAVANTEIKLFKHGATTLANKNSGGSTHIASGIHYCVLDDTDTNTAGILKVFVVVSGNLIWEDSYTVLPATSYDALIGNTGVGIPANVASIVGTAANATKLGKGAAAIKTGTVSGTPTATEIRSTDINVDTADVLNGRTLHIASGTYAGTMTTITDHGVSGSDSVFTVTSLGSRVPSAADEIEIY